MSQMQRLWHWWRWQLPWRLRRLQRRWLGREDLRWRLGLLAPSAQMNPRTKAAAQALKKAFTREGLRSLYQDAERLWRARSNPKPGSSRGAHPWLRIRLTHLRQKTLGKSAPPAQLLRRWLQKLKPQLKRLRRGLIRGLRGTLTRLTQLLQTLAQLLIGLLKALLWTLGMLMLGLLQLLAGLLAGLAVLLLELLWGLGQLLLGLARPWGRLSVLAGLSVLGLLLGAAYLFWGWPQSGSAPEWLHACHPFLGLALVLLAGGVAAWWRFKPFSPRMRSGQNVTSSSGASHR